MIELLTVMAIIAMMTGLLIPAISNQKNAGDVTMAAHTVANVLESARSYARANNVYVWVGFFEEDASSSTSGVKGNGRVIVSVVASKDGTSIYDSDNVSAATSLDPARLVQLNRLYKINNLHLKTFSDGSGTGSTFDTRPTVGTTKAQIGDTTPNASTIPFQYPVGAGATATYKFDKVIQFNPRGEIRVASLDSGDTEFAMHPIVEIGLQPTHGAVIDASTPNTSAVQITGIAGNVAIYRK